MDIVNHFMDCKFQDEKENVNNNNVVENDENGEKRNDSKYVISVVNNFDNTINDVEKERKKEIEKQYEEINGIDKKIIERKIKANELKVQVNILKESINQTNKQIASTEFEIQQYNQQIKTGNEKLNNATVLINVLGSNLDNLLSHIKSNSLNELIKEEVKIEEKIKNNDNDSEDNLWTWDHFLTGTHISIDKDYILKSNGNQIFTNSTAIGNKVFSSGIHEWELYIDGLSGSGNKYWVIFGVIEPQKIDQNDSNIRKKMYAWSSEGYTYNATSSYSSSGGPVLQHNATVRLCLNCETKILTYEHVEKGINGQITIDTPCVPCIFLDKVNNSARLKIIK
eukprot:TRINITY_DN889_c0_g1_i1.p1 TRINITY_DN889_c0_g1~~TRINITY_DN889_c0_g1_i1.p1  ORF type:complete len:382 (+),score=104.01 TRINITY_DN889_c0_g1_i1:131-1147(+)